MKAAEHMELARQWRNSAAKLDPASDQLALFEISMMWGTALLNAALHELAITEPEADQKHSDKPAYDADAFQRFPDFLQDMFKALGEIEKARELYCRGIDPDSDKISAPRASAEAVKECLAHIAQMERLLSDIAVGKRGR